MPESGRRVVLLARPGAACDRVRAALSEVGAELLLEADPTQVAVDELAAARAQLVIVVLDSATEAALDRFDAVLLDPAVDVMYEEAELAANRSGWDAARWTRHLAAKLHGHGDVLPPGRPPVETAVAAPIAAADEPTRIEPVQAETDVPVGDVDVPALGAETPAAELSLDVGAADACVSDEGVAGAAVDFDLSTFESFAPALDAAPPHPLSDDFSAGVEPGSFAGFDPVTAEMADIEFGADQVITFDPGLREDFAATEPYIAPATPGFGSGFEDDLMLPGTAVPAVPADNMQFHDLSLDDLRGETTLPTLEVPEPAFDVLPAQAAATDDASASPFAGLSDGHVLALVTDEAHAPVAAPSRVATNIADIEQRIASLSLVEDVAPLPGAVLLVAGLGGPDAVRQVLGALPEGFPRPVLVQQRLDGGRYDRLVTQLQRATSLPVDLADAGAEARPGVVYVLPDGVGLAAGPDGLRFDGSDPLDVLPPGDSAVLLLSGADASLATRLSEARWSPAFVAGQSADGCYDATASNALAERGRQTAPPAELAQQLVERWRA